MHWSILGIHGDPDDVTLAGGVVSARVRLFLNDDGSQFVDEDFPLPFLPPGVPPTEAVFGAMLAPTIDARHRQLLTPPV